jgi:hypothetical protein
MPNLSIDRGHSTFSENDSCENALFQLADKAIRRLRNDSQFFNARYDICPAGRIVTCQTPKLNCRAALTRPLP